MIALLIGKQVYRANIFSKDRWLRALLRMADFRGFGRICGFIASWTTTPYHGRSVLARMCVHGFIAPNVVITHSKIALGAHVCLGDKTMIQDAGSGGKIQLMDHVHIYGDSFIETGMGGEIFVDVGTHIQPGCHIHAFLSEIRIGSYVEIAPRCAFYNYDHKTKRGEPIMNQGLLSKGNILIKNGAWLGHGVTVLGGVTIGEGAVIGAGSVVTKSVPDYAIAAGVPAKVFEGRPSQKLERLG